MTVMEEELGFVVQTELSGLDSELSPVSFFRTGS
jgi:hypothetical protein